MCFIYPFYTVFLFFFATDIAINQEWPCIIAFGKERTTKCGKHARFNRISLWNFCPKRFVCQAYCSIGVSVFTSNVEGKVILKYKGWYFAIAMPKFLLWWEIWNIIIHSNNRNIKTLVTWSTKLTAPTVCCWYGRSNSVCWGTSLWKVENWQEKMTLSSTDSNRYTCT